ncbi:MAG: hypothetical protein ACOX0T_12605 [Pelotomaculum sp.]
MESLAALEDEYRELLAKKEAVILSDKGSQARPLLELSEELKQ